MISKSYSNILVEQLFLHFFNAPSVARFPKILDLYLKDVGLFEATLSGFPASVIGH